MNTIKDKIATFHQCFPLILYLERSDWKRPSTTLSSWSCIKVSKLSLSFSPVSLEDVMLIPIAY